MRFSRFIYKLTILSVFAVFLLSLTGCGESKFELSPEQKSPQGVSLEDALPADTVISVSINTQNKEQREKFENLKSYFPNEDYDKLIKSALDDLNMELTDIGLSYENDIAPLFSEKFKGVFGITGEFPKTPKLKKGEKASVKAKSPDMIIAFTVADPKKAEEIINIMAEKNSNAALTKVFDFPALDNKKESMYLALYKDVVIMSTTENNRFEAIKRLRNNENSLLANESYKKALKSLPQPNLGMVYMNVNRLFEEISKSEDVKMPASEFIKAIQFEAFAFVAENDGLKMVAQVGMDQNSKFNINKFPYKNPYLYKNLPGNDLMMFAEGYGIKDFFEIETDILFANKADRDDFERIKRLMKSYIGLDLENDILVWMDKGYAFAMQRNDGLIPGLSLYIDASTDPKSAAKTTEVIDTAFNQLVDSVMADGDPLLEKILNKKLVKMGETEDELNLVSIDFTQLTEEELKTAEIPAGLFNEPLEIYYGLTKNNLFVFSTYTGLKEEWGKKELTVAENPAVKESMIYLNNYPYQFSYLNIDETVKYAERFIVLMEGVKGDSIPKDVAEAFQKVKNYLAPIKYLVGGNQKVENIAEGMMFIKMEKPKAAEQTEEDTSAEVNE